MAELNGGQIVARQLQAAGIDTIFGVVGGPMIQVFAGARSTYLKAHGTAGILMKCYEAPPLSRRKRLAHTFRSSPAEAA